MTKADWRKIIAAFSILAVLWTIGGFIAASNYNRISDEEDRLATLSVNATAALCLQAYAPEEGDPSEKSLVVSYVDELPIPLSNDVCRRAVAKARALIEGD
jgi:hypothetical protein